MLSKTTTRTKKKKVEKKHQKRTKIMSESRKQRRNTKVHQWSRQTINPHNNMPKCGLASLDCALSTGQTEVFDKIGTATCDPPPQRVNFVLNKCSTNRTHIQKVRKVWASQFREASVTVTVSRAFKALRCARQLVAIGFVRFFNLASNGSQRIVIPSLDEQQAQGNLEQLDRLQCRNRLPPEKNEGPLTQSSEAR